MIDRCHFLMIVIIATLLSAPMDVRSEVAVLEISCATCGYRERLIQGADEADQANNVQNIIVVCERSRQIRNIRIPIDPGGPLPGEPLLARRYGNGRSELLGVELPRFLVPGNTCPLFPIAAYLESNICPIDSSQGFTFTVIGQY
ncbi:MAG: hypothetical protein NTY51_07145 [Deltaproteobacteria bacterium]|nr:hypothetical protein [Deltaproteobacteria bacterium]